MNTKIMLDYDEFLLYMEIASNFKETTHSFVVEKYENKLRKTHRFFVCFYPFSEDDRIYSYNKIIDEELELKEIIGDTFLKLWLEPFIKDCINKFNRDSITSYFIESN